VVTSSLKRKEEPEAIIQEILAGIPPRAPAKILTEPDRGKAIALAIKTAKAGDVVVLAGKGQETYQIVGTEKFHMDEREIVKAIEPRTQK